MQLKINMRPIKRWGGLGQSSFLERQHRQSGGGEIRGLPDGCGEAGVSLASRASPGHDDLLSRPLEVMKQLGSFRIGVYNRSHGHPDGEVRAAPAELALALPVLTSPGLEMLLIAKLDQRVYARVAEQQHAAAVSPIAPVRSAPRDVFLSAETHAAVAAPASLHHDSRLINKHVSWLRSKREKSAGRGRSVGT